MGKKKQPFYRIVAIDSRESRNGKYLENIGYYNPLPEQIDLNVKTDRALYWLQKGAQPSDTVKSLLRKRGVMMRFDLLKSGKSEEEIDQEIKKWQLLQDERGKRMEAAQAQTTREQKP
jgi:small subunit ribosomal protein S16